jgi:outer membrane receptor protein involved in Fe transport
LHLGDNPAYTLFDLSAGIEKNGMSIELVGTNVFDKRAELARFGECLPAICTQNYIVPNKPRTVALRFGQKF